MTERKETDAERAYRLLAEYMTDQANQYDEPFDNGEYDDEPEPDYDYPDEHDLDAYQVGYAEGYRAGKAFNSMSFRLYRAVPHAVRNRWYAIRRRLFPNNSDIPF